MDLWIKHPRSGEKDTMLTLAVFATASAIIKFALNATAIGDVTFGTVDAGLMAALLAPTLGAYCARKHTDKTIIKEEK